MRNGLKSIAHLCDQSVPRTGLRSKVSTKYEYRRHWLRSCHVGIGLDQLRRASIWKSATVHCVERVLSTMNTRHVRSHCMMILNDAY